MLAQSGTNPETLLPPSFRQQSGVAARTFVAEYKDAIDAATHELGEWKTRAEGLKSATAERESTKKKNAADRDKCFQTVTSLKARMSNSKRL